MLRAATSRTRLFSTSALSRMKVVPVPVREDNYAYLLIDESSKEAAVVDPYDVEKVQEAADGLGVKIVANLTTHHHFDHAGGNEKFKSIYADVPIYGGSEKVAAVTKIVKDKDELSLGSIRIKCLATPCHTQDSICYHVTDDTAHPGGVFTGDTLFIAGSGRFFEGTGEEMDTALTYLGKLPDETIVYNGHEYTKSSMAFGLHVDPENEGLKRLKEIVENNKVTAGLTTIGDEKDWNVFMRLDSDPIKKATGASGSSAIMAALRELKNNYRG